MPHDIFISYSSKDSEHAQSLTELLQSEGIGVWIDKQGIVGAEKWATEIVEGIKACSTFILLISDHSVQSENVLRELSLASESRKRILPVEIERIELPSSFMYPLAGLQHVKISDFDKILHAHKHGVEKVIKKDERKSLMILPFEDLSPTGDNGWFADGIVSELISALSNVKSIRIADNQATKEFRKYNGQLTTYAREMNFRYFVQGDVRKFGDNIKITARLLDIESGDHLWQESMKGTMENIFDFQEEVALKVVKGLKVRLAEDEKRKLSEHGTENAEAYELQLKASEYFSRQTKEGFQLAVQLTTEALVLDPEYVNAYQNKATALASLYRNYDRDPQFLKEAESLCGTALRLKPDFSIIYYPLWQIYLLQGKRSEAEEIAKEFVRKSPENGFSYSSLGLFYHDTGQDALAIAATEEAVRLMPDDRLKLFNLVAQCSNAKETENCVKWAAVALPVFERHMKLHPDDESGRIQHALLLFWCGRTDDVRRDVEKLKNARDSNTLFNTACLFAKMGEIHDALEIFRRAIEAGYKVIYHMKNLLEEENDGLASLAGTPEYEEVKRMVEAVALKIKN